MHSTSSATGREELEQSIDKSFEGVFYKEKEIENVNSNTQGGMY